MMYYHYYGIHRFPETSLVHYDCNIFSFEHTATLPRLAFDHVQLQSLSFQESSIPPREFCGKGERNAGDT